MRNVYRMPTNPDWYDHAACRGKPAQWWFPDHAANTRNPYRNARLICSTCPVATECLAVAIVTGEDHGMYGGTSPRERRNLRRVATIDYDCRLCLNRIRHKASERRSAFCYECSQRQRRRSWQKWNKKAYSA